MSRVLYIDCIGGVAGDMLLGALIDAGATVDLDGLGVEGLRIELGKAERHGITATTVQRRRRAAQPHRALVVDPRADRRGASCRRASASARRSAFERLAIAEGRIHGIDPEQRALPRGRRGRRDRRGRRRRARARVACTSTGSSARRCRSAAGSSNAAHGRLPLPAPATVSLLEGAPVYGVEIDIELVTPTGAALVAVARDGFGPMPTMTLEGSGYGAGTRDLEAAAERRARDARQRRHARAPCR